MPLPEFPLSKKAKLRADKAQLEMTERMVEALGVDLFGENAVKQSIDEARGELTRTLLANPELANGEDTSS